MLTCFCEQNCRKLPKIAILGRIWQGRPPENTFCKIILKFHFKTISVSEDISNVNNDTLTNFFLWNPRKWLLGPPEPPLPLPSPAEARCYFAINFVTRFHKLHIMRDWKTPVKPFSLGGINTPENLVYYMINYKPYIEQPHKSVEF